MREKQIEVCLVGKQGEYGDQYGHVAAENLVESAVGEYKVKSVQTLLDPSRPTPYSVELDLQCSSILITTRMRLTFGDIPRRTANSN